MPVSPQFIKMGDPPPHPADSKLNAGNEQTSAHRTREPSA
jgi:hypothetical protein